MISVRGMVDPDGFKIAIYAKTIKEKPAPH
jgi:hypothetical protein